MELSASSDSLDFGFAPSSIPQPGTPVRCQSWLLDARPSDEETLEASPPQRALSCGATPALRQNSIGSLARQRSWAERLRQSGPEPLWLPVFPQRVSGTTRVDSSEDEEPSRSKAISPCTASRSGGGRCVQSPSRRGARPRIRARHAQKDGGNVLTSRQLMEMKLCTNAIGEAEAQLQALEAMRQTDVRQISRLSGELGFAKQEIGMLREEVESLKFTIGQLNGSLSRDFARSTADTFSPLASRSHEYSPCGLRADFRSDCCGACSPYSTISARVPSPSFSIPDPVSPPLYDVDEGRCHSEPTHSGKAAHLHKTQSLDGDSGEDHELSASSAARHAAVSLQMELRQLNDFLATQMVNEDCSTRHDDDQYMHAFHETSSGFNDLLNAQPDAYTSTLPLTTHSELSTVVREHTALKADFPMPFERPLGVSAAVAARMHYRNPPDRHLSPAAATPRALTVASLRHAVLGTWALR
ncbi:hypothetical protein AB1Y20_022873 [Prymnesium parvum]|uniref:Uncharacterized protein n=1 Tax=Prymnesium parvum TaxID=97485 RepID=A0AB34JDR8_PRYPA